MLANNETGVIQPIGELADIAHAHGEPSSTPTPCRPPASSPSTSTSVKLRPPHHLRPQDVRPTGRRRPLRPPENAARAALLRRPARAPAPRRHRKRPRHRRPRPSRRARLAMARSRRIVTISPPSAIASNTASSLPSLLRHQRRSTRRNHRAPSPTPPTSTSTASMPKHSSSRSTSRPRRQRRLRLPVGRHRALARPHRHGPPRPRAHASIRISLSRLNTPAEIDRALEIIPAAVTRLRQISAAPCSAAPSLLPA